MTHITFIDRNQARCARLGVAANHEISVESFARLMYNGLWTFDGGVPMQRAQYVEGPDGDQGEEDGWYIFGAGRARKGMT